MKLQRTITALASIFLLSACGGGNYGKRNVIKILQCTKGMTTVKKDDKITALTANAKVKVAHAADGSKSACTLSGEAKIN